MSPSRCCTLRRREDAEPGRGLKSRHHFPDRRQVRKRRLPLVARHTIGTQLARANLLGPGHHADEHQVDLTAEQIREYLKNSVVCPSGGKTFSDSYRLGTVEEKPSCLKSPATHKLPTDTGN